MGDDIFWGRCGPWSLACRTALETHQGRVGAAPESGKGKKELTNGPGYSEKEKQMASEKVSFGTTCINRETRMGELWGPQPFPGVPLCRDQTRVLQQIQAKAQGWVPDSVRPPADGSQPSSTGVPAHSQASLHPCPIPDCLQLPKNFVGLRQITSVQWPPCQILVQLGNSR